MKNVEYITPIIPTHNRVLVKIKNTYDEKVSKGGIILPNMAHEDAQADSAGFNLSEWIIREGIVERMPRVIGNGYDWKPKHEINVGDRVYFPIVRFFDYPVLKIDDDYFLVVDYFDIYMRERDGVREPVNGYVIFRNETKKEKYLDYEVEKPSEWFTIEKMGQEVEYEYEELNYEREFKEGDRVILNVPPFKHDDIYLAQTRHIQLGVFG